MLYFILGIILGVIFGIVIMLKCYIDKVETYYEYLEDTLNEIYERVDKEITYKKTEEEQSLFTYDCLNDPDPIDDKHISKIY